MTALAPTRLLRLTRPDRAVALEPDSYDNQGELCRGRYVLGRHVLCLVLRFSEHRWAWALDVMPERRPPGWPSLLADDGGAYSLFYREVGAYAHLSPELALSDFLRFQSNNRDLLPWPK